MRSNLFSTIVTVVAMLQLAIFNSLSFQENAAEPNRKQQEPTITIVRAVFGTGKGATTCERNIKNIIQKKSVTTTITTRGLNLKNRRGKFRDELRINYRVNDGAEAMLTIKNGEKVNLYVEILKHAKIKIPLAVVSGAPQLASVIDLPGKMSQFCTTGNGKYLVCQIEDQLDLLIVDIPQRKIVKKVPVSDGVVFAVSKDKLLVALPMIHQLQKWDLATLKREAVAELDRDATPKLAVMGGNSDGPLGLWSKGQIVLWDIESMSLLELQDKLFAGSVRHGVGLTVSADGQTFCGWITGISSQAFNVFRIRDGFATVSKTDTHSMNERWVMPNPDGSLLLRYGAAAYAYDLKSIPLENFKNQILLPTQDPRFILALKPSKQGSYSVTICNSTDFKTVCNAGIFDVVSGGISTTRARLGMEPAIRFFPNSNVFVSIPGARDSIHVKEFDLKKVLDDKKVPYLFAVSRPPAVANPGETLVYQIQSLTNSPKVTYELDMGPKGMAVSSAGTVTWPINELPRNGVASVVVSIAAENGETAAHGFAVHVPSEIRIQVAKSGVSDKSTDLKSKQSKSNSGDNKTNENPSANMVDSKLAADENSAASSVNGTQQIFSFGERFANTCYGGAGQFMIFHFDDSDEIRIFNLVTRKVTATINAPDDALFAANKEDVIVIFPTERRLERWSLKRGEKTRTSGFQSKANPAVAAMGASGSGPLAIWSGGEVQLFSSETLEPIASNGPRISGDLQHGLEMTVSGDGKTFCGWPTKISNQHFSIMRIDGDHTTLTKTPEAHSNNHRWITPTANGSRFFTYDGKGHERNLQPIEPNPVDKEWVFPTHDPRFVMRYRSQDKDKCQFTVFTTTGLEPLINIDQLKTHAGQGHIGRPARLGTVPRIGYFPDKNLFSYIPHTNDQVVLQTADLNQSLAKTKPEFLIISSSPPPTAKVGDTYSYQLDSLSNTDKVNYSIEAAPDGMKINSSGLLTWTVDSRPVGGLANVTIKAQSNDSLSATQTFELTVQRHINRKILTRSKIKDPTIAGFVAIDGVRLELPAKATSVTPGLDGRQLLLCQNFLAVLGADGWTIQKLHSLDKAYLKIFERDDYYVAIAEDPKGVYILDKTSLKIKKSQPLQCRNLIDLVPHPTLPISYVSMRKSTDFPGSSFVMFDELTGQGNEDSKWIGNWIVIDPSGKHLLAGFKDSYRKGSELVMNPTRWHVSPTYGSIDWILRFRLDRKGIPEFDELKEEIGANGKGLRLSADGKRITYLSYTGHPKYSHNLSGWDPMDFSRIPNNYMTKDISSCQSFAYHPALPLGASPGSNSVSIYDQESGQLLKNRFQGVQPEIVATQHSSLHFSQNGKHLIVAGQLNDIHYLQKLNLKLSQQELTHAANAIPQSRAMTTKKPKPAGIPLAKIEALAGGSNEKIDLAGIARNFKDSVMVVKSGSSSGTGFVVGKSGYVLTCAHCVPDADDIELSLIQKSGKLRTFKAMLLMEDDKKDIALLKIETTHIFHPVQLGVGHSVEMGMPVSVIGNPGVGSVILDYTMTAGIVSNTRRKFADVEHIQISAAVNPGNSGGPMFDEFGNVTGMVVLKANIEGASFAIPANVLADFIMSHLADGENANAIERTWYNTDGTGPLTATFLGYDKETVLFKRSSDGKTFEMDVEKLSDPDKTFLRIFARHNR